MHTDFLKSQMNSNPDHIVMIWNDQPISNKILNENINLCKKFLTQNKIFQGSVISLEGDFSPTSISMLLALIDQACIIVPLSYLDQKNLEQKYEIAEIEFSLKIEPDDSFIALDRSYRSTHSLYQQIRGLGHPGLVLFSSGTSGQPKAAVHDFLPLLEKFKISRNPYLSINFLLFDHWGGLNTLFSTLSSRGTIICLHKRTPEEVCRLIEKYSATLLPTTPTFINMLLLSNLAKKYDLSSLRRITYGAEPMPLTTLYKLSTYFPKAQIQQTYGLIEVGVLSSKSLNRDSLWVKVGGRGYETRIIDGLLEIKSTSMILGYLNAESPFTEDGWFRTGDAVETKDEYIRVLGRKSELINVGGEKVYPTEIESVILQCPNVLDVQVYAEKNILIGNIICAKVLLQRPEDHELFSQKLKSFCQEKLEKFKVPVKIFITENLEHSARFKKKRVSLDN